MGILIKNEKFLNFEFLFFEIMEDAQAKFDEAVAELTEAWAKAFEEAGNPAALLLEKTDLVAKVEFMEEAEAKIREEMDEKCAERDDIMEKIERFNEVKGELEELCEKLGIENEELTVLRNKIQEECDALELENGNFADLVGEAEAQKARQDELNAEKEELEIRQVELQSEHDKESEANRKILKKYKKMMKKKKKLELALEIIGSDSD